jgi:hypothetical protein
LTPQLVGRQAREVFLKRVADGLLELAKDVEARLTEAMDAATNVRDAQDRRDAWQAYKKGQRPWVEGTVQAWRKALVAPAPSNSGKLSLDGDLKLVDDGVVQSKIVAGRMNLAIADKVTWELNDLRVRIQALERIEELPAHDILKTDVLCAHLLEQWEAQGLTLDAWGTVQSHAAVKLVPFVKDGYKKANDFLVAKGVLPEIDLRGLVKRAPGARTPGGPGPMGGMPGADVPGSGAGALTGYASLGDAGPGYLNMPGSSGGYDPYGGTAGGLSGYGMPGGGSGAGYAGGGQPQATGFGSAPSGMGGQQGPGGITVVGGMPGGGQSGQPGAGFPGSGVAGGAVIFGGGPGAASGPGGFVGGPGGPGGAGGPGFAGGATGMPGQPMSGQSAGSGSGGWAGSGAGAGYDETRMQTGMTPLLRVRSRAQGVMGQLRRFILDRVGDFDGPRAETPSQELSAALSGLIRTAGGGGSGGGQAGSGGGGGSVVMVTGGMPLAVAMGAPGGQVMGIRVIEANHTPEEAKEVVKEATQELKKKAETDSEKATIEIVALMFTSILNEDRLPPSVRVWFARLQMPVLRLALTESEFFESLQHPARKLLDRMGSCVLGFDAADLSGHALEQEIKRVVQVIEQYPETGRRVFELVLKEFETFLSKHLADKGPAKQLVSVAQQVEQKEALAIQYTIEMRNSLKDMPLRDEIRDYLFKVWSDVLAVASVKYGPKSVETLAYKKFSSDLVWAASAKPNRNDRAKVIADLPRLLQQMGEGMTLMGLQENVQKEHIKLISDTLAEAFMSRTEAIDPEVIAKMGRRLENLEEYFDDDGVGDIPLDNESIEMMLGIDTSNIVIISDGGTRANQSMQEWAKALEVGAWFTLDHNGHNAHVQFGWRSERGNLNLFATSGGKSYLIQAGRLAAYLQAGLLLPIEEESLTTRATRAALTKLDANPERLLQ